VGPFFFNKFQFSGLIGGFMKGSFPQGPLKVKATLGDLNIEGCSKLGPLV